MQARLLFREKKKGNLKYFGILIKIINKFTVAKVKQYFKNNTNLKEQQIVSENIAAAGRAQTL